jgi:hypothetical protein
MHAQARMRIYAWFVSYSVPHLSRKDAGICAYCTVGREPGLYLYVKMISSVHNLLCTYILGADLFQILLLKISY